MKNKVSESPIDQYYAEISERVIVLLKNKQYQTALNLLKEELEQPYIPENIYLNLTKSMHDIENIISEFKYNDEIKKLSKLELWNKIYNSAQKKIDIVYLNLLVEKNDNKFDELDLQVISEILIDKHIDNADKSYILDLLQEFKVDRKFTYYNNFLKLTTEINALNLDEVKAQLKVVAKEIENAFFKDPSKLEIALNLLQVLSIKYTPFHIKYSNHDIINTLKNITNSLFGLEEIEDNEIKKTLSEFLE